MEKEINILIDFNSYSPLVLFDENTKFENEEDEKKTETGKMVPNSLENPMFVFLCCCDVLGAMCCHFVYIHYPCSEKFYSFK